MLCSFMLKIKPGCITQKINPLAKKFEFYAFETIGFFLKATKDLGVTETFAPGDLFERKNMEKVLTLLCSLGRTANKKGLKAFLFRDRVEGLESIKTEEEFKEWIKKKLIIMLIIKRKRLKNERMNKK